MPSTNPPRPMPSRMPGARGRVTASWAAPSSVLVREALTAMGVLCSRTRGHETRGEQAPSDSADGHQRSLAETLAARVSVTHPVNKKGPLSGAFLLADDGIRTHDLLHGKRIVVRASRARKPHGCEGSGAPPRSSNPPRFPVICGRFERGSGESSVSLAVEGHRSILPYRDCGSDFEGAHAASEGGGRLAD